MKSLEIPINGYPVRIDLAQDRTKPKVACLGPEGTYTEAARHELLGPYLYQMDPNFLPHNPAIVQEVERGNYDIGIVAIENSTEGNVGEVLRELHHAEKITVLGTIFLPIQHMLIGRLKKSISEIHSHPQALGQCRTYLLNNYPEAKQESALSTAAAVELVKTNKRIAAIASRRAAEVNNLPILAEDIGDIKGNTTQFLMIGRGNTYPTDQDETMFIFGVQNRQGILTDCLNLLCKPPYSLNLAKIESRPTGITRQYGFLTIIDGHQDDKIVKEALDRLKTEFCSSFRMFGSYRKPPVPEGFKAPGSLNGIN